MEYGILLIFMTSTTALMCRKYRLKHRKTTVLGGVRPLYCHWFTEVKIYEKKIYFITTKRRP